VQEKKLCSDETYFLSFLLQIPYSVGEQVSSPSRVVFKFWRFFTGGGIRGLEGQPGLHCSQLVSAAMSWSISAKIQGLIHSWPTRFWELLVILR